jgi:hypothetical protein
VATALLSKVRAELTSQQAQIVDTLKRQCPGFAVMRKLVLSFRVILRGGKVTTLHRWMEEALKTGIHSLVRFVRTLKQDLSAVQAAMLFLEFLQRIPRAKAKRPASTRRLCSGNNTAKSDVIAPKIRDAVVVIRGKQIVSASISPRGTTSYTLFIV